MNIGMIGMGKMGLLHSAILNGLEDTDITSIADTEKTVISFFQKFSGAKVYNDFNEMIKNEALDVVFITTPVRFHVPIATICAKRNIHFFIEKPLGISSLECNSLCKAMKKSKSLSMVGYYLRYVETFSQVKKLLDKEIIGEITKIKSSVYQSQFLKKPSGWRFDRKISGGGVLIDLGSHLIDLLLWYFGKISKIEGSESFNYNQEIEDTVNAKLEFENGIIGEMEASWNIKNHRLQETTITIKGTLGNIKVKEDYIKISFKNKEDEKIIYRQELSSGVPIDVGGPEYTREDIDFINYIKDNKQPMIDVFSAMKTQCVIDTIYRAAKSNQKETVEYFE
jgi:predicted dehydrogenase